MNQAAIFGNHKQASRWLAAQLHKSAVAADAPFLTGRHWKRGLAAFLRAAENKHIILVFRNEQLQEVSEAFHQLGIFEMSVFPWDTHFFGRETTILQHCLTAIDNSKPRLDRVEIELNSGCNLNCKGCFQFSNLVNGKCLADLDAFTKDLQQLKKFFWGIGKIRLQGGEPLLNPDFLLFIKAARKIFPDSDLRLVSNSLLLEQLERGQLAVIRQYNCSIDISAYPPTRKKLKSITDYLDAAGVSYNVSLPIKVFYKGLLATPAASPDRAYDHCIFTRCHSLERGLLGACTRQFYSSRLNEAFGLHYPARDPEEVVDLYHTSLNGWEINRLFGKAHPFCSYCSPGLEPFAWKTAPKNSAKAEDWIIAGNPSGRKAAALLQKFLKPFAVRLRRRNQRPKRRRH